MAENNKKRTVPTVYGFVVKPKHPEGCPLFVFFCQHCQEWHVHGWNSNRLNARTDGHRWAHCSNPGSLYQEAGYNLKKMSARNVKTMLEMLSRIF